MEKLLTTSIIVTIKNDPIGLKNLLRDIQKQTKQPTEVIFVLAGATQDELSHINKTHGLPLRFFVLDAATTRSSARNFGAQKSKADLFVFTDAGCSLDSQWLEHLTEPFLSSEIKLVSGFTQTQSESSWDEAQGFFVFPQKIEASPLPATRNMAILRSIFNKEKGFDDKLNFGEDYEFSLRLRKSGVVSVFAPKALVFWRPRQSLWAFFTMILNLTAGDIQAGNMRLGHFSMWFRYSILIAIFVLIQVFSNTSQSLLAVFILYLIYLFLKNSRTPLKTSNSRLWHLILQPTCDGAVLLGSLVGLVWRARAGENRQE